MEVTIHSVLVVYLQGSKALGCVLPGQKLPTGNVDYTHCYIECWSQTRDTTGSLVSPTSLGWFHKREDAQWYGMGYSLLEDGKK